MIRIYCPYCCEEREEVEFGYAGEAFITRPPKPHDVDDAAWRDYLFNRSNPKGSHFEQWVHRAACRKYFIVERDTASHTIRNVWPFETAPRPEAGQQ